MHTAVWGGTEFGADFPGVLQSKLAKEFGPNFVSLFAEGTAGDINHIDVANSNSLSGEAEVAHIGNLLAGTVLASRTSLRKIGHHDVLFASQTVRAKIKPVDQVRYQQAVEMFESLETVEVDFMSLVAGWRDMHAFRYLEQYGDEGKPLGSYEVTTCPLAPGCGELMIQTASHLLDQLKGTQ